MARSEPVSLGIVLKGLEWGESVENIYLPVLSRERRNGVAGLIVNSQGPGVLPGALNTPERVSEGLGLRF